MLPDRGRVLVRLSATAALAIGVWGVARSADSVPAMIALTLAAGLCSSLAMVLLAGPVKLWCAAAEIEFDLRDGWYTALAVISGLLGGATVWVSDHSMVAWLLLLPIGLWAAAVDAQTSRIPAVLTYWAAAGTALLLVLASLVARDPSALIRALLVGTASSFTLFLLAVLTSGGIGMADVRLAFPLGAVLGYLSWQLFLPGLVLPLLLMFPVAVSRIWKGAHRSEGMAAGPYMVSGCALLIALHAIHG